MDAVDTGTETLQSLRRLANRVVWPGFSGTTLPSWAVEALEEGLAGLVYFEQNIGTPAEVATLSRSIHEIRPDALIGVDEEGGIVTRLESGQGSSTPGNAVLGRIDDVALTERAARWTGELVRSLGIDVDLAPTVDVNTDARNPVIGVRSFGASAALVSRHSAAAVRGLQSAGVAACAKHFPGHGDTSTDSHLALAVANAGLDEIVAVHLEPFRAAIAAGVRAVMTAHLRVAGLGEEPATINPAAIGLLRSLGFDGVVVSDALDMAAIRHTVGMGAGAVAALHAGVDLLCIGNPAANPPKPGGATDELEFLEVRDAIVAAMRTGELAVERVEQAAARVAGLAEWVRRQPASAEPPAPYDWVGATAAVVDVTGDPRLPTGEVTVVDARTKRNIATGPRADHITRALAARRAVRRVWLADASDAARASALAADALAAASAAVLLVNQPQASALEARVLSAVLERRPDTVVVFTGWPPDAADRPRDIVHAVYSYGAGRVNGEAVARLLA